MNVNSWLTHAKTRIAPLEAELIMQSALGVADRSELVLLENRPLSKEEISTADTMVAEREHFYPLAYVLGEKEFYGRSFVVNPAVLIPRPETEGVVESVLELKPRSVLDVGTGSGCIAITLALELKNAKVTGTDVDAAALKIASRNASNLKAKVKWGQSDLLAQFQKKVDVVVANLPYVSPHWEWRSPELKYEPARALFTEDDGLALIKRLLLEMRAKTPSKYLVLEADPCQHRRVIEFAAEQGFSLVKAQNFGLVFLV